MRITTIFITVLFANLLLSATGIAAQNEIYRWVDENGVVHFGNQPDGQTEAEQVKIRKDPKLNGQPIAGPAPTVAGETPAPSYAQQRRDERALKHEEKAKKTKEMAAKCEGYRQIVARLEPSSRVIIEQADGSVSRMDDNERVETLSKSKAFIAKNCHH